MEGGALQLLQERGIGRARFKTIAYRCLEHVPNQALPQATTMIQQHIQFHRTRRPARSDVDTTKLSKHAQTTR